MNHPTRAAVVKPGTNASRETLTLGQIEERLFEAIRTLQALPDRERKWLYHSTAAAMPEPLRETMDVVIERLETAGSGKLTFQNTGRPQPEPGAIDRMLPTLRWLRWVEEREVRIIQARAWRMPWWQISSKVGRSDTTCQSWMKRALTTIQGNLERGRA